MKQLHHYAKLLQEGKIGRREFMGRAVALGATATLATSLAGRAALAATPKKGGTLRVGIAPARPRTRSTRRRSFRISPSSWDLGCATI